MTSVPSIARRRLLLASVCGLGVANVGRAQPAWPSKPIRVVVNSAAGGLTDVVARLVGAKMGPSLGQPFVVDPRSGGAGLLGAEAVGRAEPDGYTLGILASAITVAPSLVPGITCRGKVRSSSPEPFLTCGRGWWHGRRFSDCRRISCPCPFSICRPHGPAWRAIAWWRGQGNRNRVAVRVD